MRISRSEMLMEMAFTVAKRGTCSRLQVGAVISRDGRIISMGYNGAPSGLQHCDHSQDKPIGWAIPESVPIDWKPELGRMMLIDSPTATVSYVGEGCQVAEHAERNAIAFAARYGTALDGSELYVTHAPCLACARTVINAGIQVVRFTHPYRITAGVELLELAGIKVIEMSLHK